MTITQVMGCGTQKGHVNYYRGIKVEEAALLPKMKLEVVVSKRTGGGCIRDSQESSLHRQYRRREDFCVRSGKCSEGPYRRAGYDALQESKRTEIII